MVDVGKLISLENILVTWFMHIWFFPAQNKRCVWSQSHDKNNLITHSNIFLLPETTWLSQLVTHISIHATGVHIYSATFLFPIMPFRPDLFQSRTRPQTVRQISKATNVQHMRKHVLLEYTAIFPCIETSREILNQHAFIIYWNF